MNLAAEEFTPNLAMPLSDSEEVISDDQASSFEPSYKCKIKTELCKFWQRGEHCIFGESCAFAHGLEQLKKKVHVTSQYRLSHCHQFHTAPFYCFYGERCQFAHIHTDFSDFKGEKSRYSLLLSENQLIMQQRIEQSVEPDVTIFNVALPGKKRLPVFESIHPSDKKKKPVRRAKKTKSNEGSSKQLVC